MSSSALPSSTRGSRPEQRQIAAFVADLTLQKKSEEVLRRTEKLAVAGRFAASIAHEINNPLEAITNCLYLLGQTTLSETARNYLDLAQRRTRPRRADHHPDTALLPSLHTRRHSDVHDLIETVLAILDTRLRRSQIEVVRELRPIPAVLAHDGEIRQVLANLVGNAMDALPRGGSLHLRTAPATHSSRSGIAITVADTGTGMDASTLRTNL